MSEQMRDPGLNRLISAGIFVCVLFFGVLGGWAHFSQLASAAIAPGELGFDTNRKTIQHLEGGIVAEILVADGDEVNPGDVLVRLDRTQPLAVYEQVKARQLTILATEARLRAERDGLNEIAFPTELDDPQFTAHAADIRHSETRLFNTRRETLEHQRGISQQRILQLEEEIQGLTEEIASQNRQIALLHDEIGSMETLYEKKMVSKQRLLALQRETSELEGERSRNQASIARARQSISEEELRTIEIENERDAEVLSQLRQLQGDILEVTERFSAAEDVLARTDIIAPTRGTVVGLTVATIGGVIGSRQPLMDIVPAEERLLVKAYLEPKDIDAVRAGQLAFVRLTAFNQRNLLPIEGTVASVSADSLIDEQTGGRYYLARVTLPPPGDEAFQGMEIYPGMQAEVMIQVGERSPLDYLLQPLRDSMNRALRED
jgi:membrane fusion protein, type I secretion system